jgi:hypothetical protein
MEIEQIPGIPVFARTRRHSFTTFRTARNKLLAIVCQSTDLVAAAAGNPSLGGVNLVVPTSELRGFSH